MKKWNGWIEPTNRRLPTINTRKTKTTNPQPQPKRGCRSHPSTYAQVYTTPHPQTNQLTVTQVLDFVVENEFNALRVPFSLAMALDLGKVNEQWLVDEGA